MSRRRGGGLRARRRGDPFLPRGGGATPSPVSRPTSLPLPVRSPSGLAVASQVASPGAAVASPPPSSLCAPCLAVSLREGGAALWDPRAGEAVLRLRGKRRGDVGDALAAEGPWVAGSVSDAVEIWDVRAAGGQGAGGAAPFSGAPAKGLAAAATFVDTHAERVSTVALSRGGFLLSGSEDGLVAAFDLSATLDEDEAFAAALQVDSSAAGITLYRGSQEAVGGGATDGSAFIRTGTETALAWDWLSAARDEGEQGAGARLECVDARRDLGRLAGFEIDYIAGAFADAEGRLAVLAGNGQGDAAVFPADCRPAAAGAPGPELFSLPVALASGAHDDVIRAVARIADDAFATGGEDGRIALWGPGGAPNAEAGAQGGAPRRGGAGSGGPERARRLSAKRASPY